MSLSMRYRPILFLFAFVGLGQPAVGENRSVFECRHIRGSEWERAIRLVIQTEAGARVEADGNTVVLTGGSLSIHEKLRELKPIVDVMKISIPTKFIRLQFVDVAHAAALVSKAFAGRGKDQEMRLQAVPSPRTNQVFLMGTVSDMRAAEALILELDRFFVPVSSGCGR